MKTKGQRKAEDRRRLRKSNKHNDFSRSPMLGDSCRKNYGGGKV